MRMTHRTWDRRRRAHYKRVMQGMGIPVCSVMQGLLLNRMKEDL